ncbi:unannotated protein [freshwater metagenome]|uniref:Unannotated protein n=1 Tax=freshwater metagenome TaxID=449393 RepID=A0A6J6KFE4_9ZZZZ
MTNKFIELDERTLIEEHLDALPGSHFALGVLFLDCGFAARGHCFVVAGFEVSNARGSGG